MIIKTFRFSDRYTKSGIDSCNLKKWCENKSRHKIKADMRTAYQYKLLPNKEQVAVIELWLELLRRQYNYRLGERFSWWEENRCPVNACPKVHANSSTKR
ncbi:MAG: helix-turn-helix domain-containing protein [Okeania sp. SIO2B3]|nr:helix-turn-helix domain-containing protein [Okeania sp. SIO2B3]